jgi:hypothetical protein
VCYPLNVVDGREELDTVDVTVLALEQQRQVLVQHLFGALDDVAEVVGVDEKHSRQGLRAVTGVGQFVVVLHRLRYIFAFFGEMVLTYVQQPVHVSHLKITDISKFLLGEVSSTLLAIFRFDWTTSYIERRVGSVMISRFSTSSFFFLLYFLILSTGCHDDVSFCNFQGNKENEKTVIEKTLLF